MDPHVKEQIQDIVDRYPQCMGGRERDMDQLVQLSQLPHTKKPVLEALRDIDSADLTAKTYTLPARLAILNSGRTPTTEYKMDILSVIPELQQLAIKGRSGEPFEAVSDRTLEHFSEIEHYHGRDVNIHNALCDAYNAMYESGIYGKPQGHFSAKKAVNKPA